MYAFIVSSILNLFVSHILKRNAHSCKSYETLCIPLVLNYSTYLICELSIAMGRAEQTSWG